MVVMIHRCTEYEKGIGVVRIRSSPVKASTSSDTDVKRAADDSISDILSGNTIEHTGCWGIQNLAHLQRGDVTAQVEGNLKREVLRCTVHLLLSKPQRDHVPRASLALSDPVDDERRKDISKDES
jgi:hypothetical protein